jgi:hypothetical protein
MVARLAGAVELAGAARGRRSRGRHGGARAAVLLPPRQRVAPTYILSTVNCTARSSARTSVSSSPIVCSRAVLRSPVARRRGAASLQRAAALALCRPAPPRSTGALARRLVSPRRRGPASPPRRAAAPRPRSGAAARRARAAATRLNLLAGLELPSSLAAPARALAPTHRTQPATRRPCRAQAAAVPPAARAGAAQVWRQGGACRPVCQQQQQQLCVARAEPMGRAPCTGQQRRQRPGVYGQRLAALAAARQ